MGRSASTPRMRPFVFLLNLLFIASSRNLPVGVRSLSTAPTSNPKPVAMMIPILSTASSSSFLRISEQVWRQSARDHSNNIRELLKPGLTSLDHPLNSGIRRQQPTKLIDDSNTVVTTALDPQHPIYNFLIEYYGLKGVKGVKRLTRWSPNPGLLLNSNAKEDTHFYGILLEGATEDDFVTTLHLKGASIQEEGIVYSPSQFFASNDNDKVERKDISKVAAPFLWYQSILQQTLQADPILHCYGLHEWAMQYQPAGAPPPPSAKYQHHLPLRVSREVLNETVERKGVSCTHVDALRFFADAALPLNRFGGPLSRKDQVTLEQPACVHATMDLLKMTLKLQPFCDASLLQRVLEIALEARQMDVAASPYDALAYGVDAVSIETAEGRAEYKRRQVTLMAISEPIRIELLEAYNCFLGLAFAEGDLVEGRKRLLQYVA